MPVHGMMPGRRNSQQYLKYFLQCSRLGRKRPYVRKYVCQTCLARGAV